jgi:CheY-like chemotaxis protein
VLSTLHTNDAPSAVTRLVDLGIPAYLVASSVIAVQAQRLVRRLCVCKKVLPDGRAEPNGCEACRFTGYRGRMAVHELLRLTPRVRTALLSHASSDFLRQVARASGMRTMYEDGERKVAAGLTTVEELLRNVPPPELEEGEETATVGKTSPAGSVGLQVVSQAPPPPTPLAARRPRVLIVDPDAASTDVLSRTLADEHYDVSTAASARDALAAVYRESPDLILAEIDDAGGEGGVELLRKLRQSLATVRIPVLFLTAREDLDSEVQAFDAGADDYLHKPVNRDLLLSRMRRALVRSHIATAAS